MKKTMNLQQEVIQKRTGQDREYFLNVPQGCYAAITKNSPQKLKGLFTDGLGPCSCLIITDKNRDNIYLAHVDDKAMNIADPNYGIAKWIKDNNLTDLNIEIHCGTGDRGNAIELIDYRALIEAILNANGLEKLKENIQVHKTKGITASIVCRSGTRIVELKSNNKKTIIYNLPGQKSADTENKITDNYEIINFYIVNEWRNNLLSQCNTLQDIQNFKLDKVFIGKYIDFKINFIHFNSHYEQINNVVDTTLPFPPICCYDGKFFYNGKVKIEGMDNFNNFYDDVNILNKKYDPIIETYKNKLIEIVDNIKIKDKTMFETIRNQFNEQYNGIKEKIKTLTDEEYNELTMEEYTLSSLSIEHDNCNVQNILQRRNL